MPQLSLYLTQEQLSRVTEQARAENLSLSKWVVTRILSTIEPTYPENWKLLFGSLKDSSFERPSQPKQEEREDL